MSVFTQRKSRKEPAHSAGHFREDIFAAVAAIPTGKVSTYGRVAAAAGYPGAARAVGNALHTNASPETVPCHRVVRADGRLGENYAFGGPEAQKERLIAEGVPFIGDRVDLKI